jgi:hypothetical protein
MLALGIGATTAIFSVVNSIVLRPLPYPDSDRLVNIVHVVDGGRELAYFSDPIFLTYAEQNRAFESIGVWSSGVATVTGGGEPEQIRRLSVSHQVLPTLGVHPLIGRWFTPNDGAAGERPVVLLTHAFWQRRLGGERSALDRPLTINGQQVQVVGVMPPGFQFGGEHDVIQPQRVVRPGVPIFRHQGVARLKDGVTLAQANADVARMVPLWQRQGNPFKPALRPLKQDVVGDIGQTLWVLLGAISIVLLMAEPAAGAGRGPAAGVGHPLRARRGPVAACPWAAGRKSPAWHHQRGGRRRARVRRRCGAERPCAGGMGARGFRQRRATASSGAAADRRGSGRSVCW